MIYQVRSSLFFEKKEIAQEYAKITQEFMDKAVVVHPDEPNQQGCSLEMIKCYHDETPTKPCVTCGMILCPCPDPVE